MSLRSSTRGGGLFNSFKGLDMIWSSSLAGDAKPQASYLVHELQNNFGRV